MALTLPPGVTPPEIAFLCEMELITVIPRQRLPSLDLLGGSTPPLRPPARAHLPLWLALLLYRQRRANILCPPWLNPPSLSHILELETVDPEVFSPAPPWPSSGSNSLRDGAVVSPPFIHSSTGDTEEGYLPYHWIEMGEILLGACAEDIPHASQVRGLLRDIREVRMSKLRAVTKGLEGGGVFSLRGVGAMEVCAERGFVVGVVDGLRVLGESKEEKRREDEANGEEGDNDDDDDDDMEL